MQNNAATAPTASPFSLFDADLPLLAVDAASEIDAIIPEPTSEPVSIEAVELPFTKKLLERLISISSHQTNVDVDSIMYEQSLLPNIVGEKEMFQEPANLQKRLEDLMSQHSLFVAQDEQIFLSKLRDFFLEVSSFASASRRMLRRGSSPHPNATT